MNTGSIPAHSQSTSHSLLQRAQAHDPAAWLRLSQVYTPLVYQWCRRAGLQTADAADVAQEVFRGVFKGLKNFKKERPGDSFRGWLCVITRNQINNHRNAVQRRPPAIGGDAAHDAAQQLPDEVEAASSEKIRSTLARRAIALMQSDFEEKTWRAFWLTTVEHRTAQEAADELELKVASVYQAKSRVLRRLRQELDGLDLLE